MTRDALSSGEHPTVDISLLTLLKRITMVKVAGFQVQAKSLDPQLQIEDQLQRPPMFSMSLGAKVGVVATGVVKDFTKKYKTPMLTNIVVCNS
ncbi:hypothetical protein TNCV_1895071 [Trichonephila clavipes]|nr:hypothetical protein TNCV_1895071 [Trichonephila clavipes]